MTSRRERFFAPFLIFPMCGEKEGQTDDIIPRVEFVRSQFPSHCRDIRRMHLPESRSCHMRPDFLCETKFTGYLQFTKYLQELFLRKNLEECCPPCLVSGISQSSSNGHAATPGTSISLDATIATICCLTFAFVTIAPFPLPLPLQVYDPCHCHHWTPHKRCFTAMRRNILGLTCVPSQLRESWDQRSKPLHSGPDTRPHSHQTPK